LFVADIKSKYIQVFKFRNNLINEAELKNGFLTGLFIIILSVFHSSCKDDVTSVSRPLLGTAVTITLVPDSINTAELFSAAFGEIEKVQRDLSIYDPDSEISRLNRTASAVRFKTRNDIFLLIKRAVQVSGNTEGAFDITFASTGKLWDFSHDEFIPPDDKTVKRLLPLISYKNLELDSNNSTVRFLKNGTKIGLGGIAKGYAVSKAVAVLRAGNVKGAIVACAGDIQVIGRNHGKPWRAGIKDPRGDSVIGALDMVDGEAVSTSGDYERFRIVNGRRYHHIIDPSTGYPSDSGLISVSVFSSDPVMSDAYSTAFFVLGLDKTEQVLKVIKGLSVVLVTSEMKVYVSESLRGRITFREDLDIIYF